MTNLKHLFESHSIETFIPPHFGLFMPLAQNFEKRNCKNRIKLSNVQVSATNWCKKFRKNRLHWYRNRRLDYKNIFLISLYYASQRYSRIRIMRSDRANRKPVLETEIRHYTQKICLPWSSSVTDRNVSHISRPAVILWISI